jgi:hypothetical protein
MVSNSDTLSVLLGALIAVLIEGVVMLPFCLRRKVEDFSEWEGFR